MLSKLLRSNILPEISAKKSSRSSSSYFSWLSSLSYTFIKISFTTSLNFSNDSSKLLKASIQCIPDK